MAVIHGDWTSNGGGPASAPWDLIGTEENDEIFGYGGDDDLHGLEGNDVLHGHEDKDDLYGGEDNDILSGGDGDDDLFGGEDNDILSGGDGDDDLHGDEGNDSLDGGTGADWMLGGDGNDIYFVDHEQDFVAEWDTGFDEIRASINYEIADEARIEMLTLLDSGGAINGSGNSRDETINGNSSRNLLQGFNGNDTLNGGDGDDDLFGGRGNDRLDGGSGADGMYGGEGDDHYYVDNARDELGELGFGHDTVTSTVTFALPGGFEDLVLAQGAGAIDGTGNAGDNMIIGNEDDNEIRGEGGEDLLKGGGGADYLRGGADNDELHGGSGGDQLRGDAGDDHMIGGDGNDAYLVDSNGDIVDELVNGGIDTVTATGLNYYTLPLDVENLNLSYGTYGTGNNLGNTIVGNLFDNILDGLGGADTLEGRQGSDTYFVDNAGDVLIEAAGQGVDEVHTSVSYTLTAGADVEILRTTNDNATAAINLTGNGSGNEIIGNNGNNTLNGAGGTDQLRGRGGNDTYIVDRQSDTIIEAAGQGSDTMRASVSYELTAGADVEILETTFSAGTQGIMLFGNETGNDVRGNNGDNTLGGGGGNDTLTGFAGSDHFQFRAALDPVFNVDAITDFSVADDTILLGRSVFTAFPNPGFSGVHELTAAEFRIGTAAQDASDRIIYNNVTGDLLYDADGVGGTAAIRFADVTPGLALTHLDFLVA